MKSFELKTMAPFNLQVLANSRVGNRFAYLTLSRLVLSLLVTFCVGLKAPNSVCLKSLPDFIISEVISSEIEHGWWW